MPSRRGRSRLRRKPVAARLGGFRQRRVRGGTRRWRSGRRGVRGGARSWRSGQRGLRGGTRRWRSGQRGARGGARRWRSGQRRVRGGTRRFGRAVWQVARDPRSHVDGQRGKGGTRPSCVDLRSCPSSPPSRRLPSGPSAARAVWAAERTERPRRVLAHADGVGGLRRRLGPGRAGNGPAPAAAFTAIAGTRAFAIRCPR
jgi:hypothetical protein